MARGGERGRCRRRAAFGVMLLAGAFRSETDAKIVAIGQDSVNAQCYIVIPCPWARHRRSPAQTRPRMPREGGGGLASTPPARPLTRPRPCRPRHAAATAAVPRPIPSCPDARTSTPSRRRRSIPSVGRRPRRLVWMRCRGGSDGACEGAPGSAPLGASEVEIWGIARSRARARYGIRDSIAALGYASHAFSRVSGERSTRISRHRPRPSGACPGRRRRDPRHHGRAPAAERGVATTVVMSGLPSSRPL